MHVSAVGVGKRRLFANDIHGANLFRARMLHHLEVIRAHVQRQFFRRYSPGIRPFGAHGFIAHRFIAGIVVFQTAEIARALYVIVPAHRVAARAGATVVAGHQQQVGERGAGVRAVAVLSDAHRPDDADGRRVADKLGGGGQLIHRKPGNAGGEVQRERRERLAVFVHLVDVRCKKRLVGVAVVKHIARHRRGPDHIGAGANAQVTVGALGHFVTARVDHQQLLPVMFFRGLHARGDHRMVLGSVAADNHNQRRFMQIFNGARVAAITDGAEQPFSGRVLAVARRVIDAVRANDEARDFLRQIGFFVAALTGADKADGLRPVLIADRQQAARHQRQRLVPARLAKPVVLADERCGEAGFIVEEIPGEFALHAGGDAVGGRVGDRLHFQHVAVARPDFKAAPDAAVGADRFGAFDFRLPPVHVHHRNTGNDLRPGGVFDGFHQVYHRALERLLHAGKRPGVRLHGFLKQRVAGANGDAMPATHAAGAGDGVAAVPQHARVRHGVIDAQRLVDFNVLTRLHAAPAQNALIRVVGVKRVGVVFHVGFALIFVALNRDMHVCDGVVQGAVAGVVFADGAVELMFGEQPVHPFMLRRLRVGRAAGDFHALRAFQRTAAHQFALIFHPADIAGLHRLKRGVVTDVRQLYIARRQKIDKRDIRRARQRPPVIKQGTERLLHCASSNVPCQCRRHAPQRIRAASPVGRRSRYSDLKVVTALRLRQARVLRSMYGVNDSRGQGGPVGDKWLSARQLLQFPSLPGITFSYGCLDV
ncbi:FIG00554473: hypothetical protein [Cronobacter turicensis 564]|nr:FIG00554473: hypothetical protein [Cronobacter turicensis 564]